MTSSNSEHTNEQRIDRERSFHDRRFASNPLRNAALRTLTGAITLDALGLVYAVARDNCAGAMILDYGCAEGEASLILSRYGAKFVHGIDISPVAVDHAGQSARTAHVDNVAFEVMNAERLVFSDRMFDVVFGIGIIHHLDVDRATREVARVLKPNGVGIFLEPLGHNPMINLVRRLTPNARTADEHPLTMSDVALARRHFSSVDLRFVNLATLLSTPFSAVPGSVHLQRLLAKVDRTIFALAPWLGRFAWNVILTMRRPLTTGMSPGS